jgi:hypothetical protein
MEREVWRVLHKGCHVMQSRMGKDMRVGSGMDEVEGSGVLV